MGSKSKMLLFSCCRKGSMPFRRPALLDVHPLCQHDAGDSSNDALAQESWLERTSSSLRRNDIKELDVDPDKIALDGEALIMLSNAMRCCNVLSRLIFRNVETGNNKNSLGLTPLLKEVSSVSTVCLEDSGEEAVIGVVEELARSMGNLTALHLKGNVVCPKGAKALGSMLRDNRSLFEFVFCHNGVTEEGLAAIASGLRYNQSLHSLDLLGNSINDITLSKLANSLMYNKSVEFLCLDFNDFGHDGMQRIATLLRQNNTIKELHLFGNRIDSYGAEYLADALCTNRHLRKLVLSFNWIGNSGAIALANALTINTALTTLSIPSNDIDRDGLLEWGKLLPKMKGLEQLNLGVVFDNVAAEALVEGLERNTRLAVLHMESPAFDELSDVEERVDFLLRSNKSGRSLVRGGANLPTSLWAKALAKAGQNCSTGGCPDVIYSFLTEKPDIFQVVG